MCVIHETYKCKCGNTAEFIQGVSKLGDRFEQFYCKKCGKAFVTINGKYLRDGILKDEPIFNTPSF